MKLKEWLDKYYTKKEQTKLTVLFCNQESITSLIGIERLTNLNFLDCNHSKLKNLDGIENLTKLETIKCNNTSIKNLIDLKAILNLNNIKKLEIRNTSLFYKLSEDMFYRHGILPYIKDIHKLKKDIIKELRKNKINNLLK